MSDIAIRCEGLSKQYVLGEQEQYRSLRDVITNSVAAPFKVLRSRVSKSNGSSNGERANHDSKRIWALKDLSLEIKQGDAVGIIGRNGAGKSTLLKILSRITKPTKGSAKIHGRVGSLLEVGTGFHPELTGRENIFLNGAILGMRKAEIARKFDEIVAFAEVEKFIDTPVKRYSSGMYVRLAFGVAAHMETEVLLVDEVLAVGDQSFQEKCLGKMSQIAREGRTVLFVSHSMPAVTSLAAKGLLLRDGELAYAGDMQSVAQIYLSTRAGDREEWTRDHSQLGGDIVQVESVSLRDDADQNRNRFITGEDIDVRVTCSLPHELPPNLMCAVIVRTITDVPVFHMLHSFDTASWKDSRQVSFSCKIVDCKLYPGKYSISVWLGRNPFYELDFVKDVVTIDMEQGTVEGVGFDLNWQHGLVHCPSSWSLR